MRTKGEVALKILEKISEMALDSADLFIAIVTSRYGASDSEVKHKIDKLQSERTDRVLEYEKRRIFYNFLYRLENDGFIEKKKDKNGKSRWFSTNIGLRFLKDIRKSKNKPLPSHCYTKEEGKEIKIVIFDIPENKRRERAWLRGKLTHLGFKMIQKSVWLGKVQIPETFIEDLHNLNLITYIEILAISKAGSLKKVT